MMYILKDEIVFGKNQMNKKLKVIKENTKASTNIPKGMFVDQKCIKIKAKLVSKKRLKKN